MLSQREITTADDEDYAHLFVCQILGNLKKGNFSNHPFHLNHSWLCSTQARSLRLAVSFIDTGEANDDGTLATVISMVEVSYTPWLGLLWWFIIPLALRALSMINPIATRCINYTSTTYLLVLCYFWDGSTLEWLVFSSDRVEFLLHGGHGELRFNHNHVCSPRMIITILPLFYLTCRRVPGLPAFQHETLKSWEWAWGRG